VGERRGRGVEVVFILLLSLGLFLAVALFTHTPRDIFLEHGQHNWCGPAGVQVSHFLFELLGFSAYLFLTAVLAGALQIALHDEPWTVLLKPCALLGVVVFLAAFLQLHVEEVQLGGLVLSAGGRIGQGSAEVLRENLGTVGATVLLLGGVLALMVAILEVSLVTLARLVLRLGRVVAAVLGRSIGAFLALGRALATWFARGWEQPETRPDHILLTPVVPTRPHPPARDQAEEDEECDDQPEEEQRTPLDPPSGTVPVTLPPLDLLANPPQGGTEVDESTLRSNAEILQRTLGDFGVLGRVVNIQPGPVITLYEYQLAPEIKLKQIMALGDDLAMDLKTESVRISPLPGKGTVGIELPNRARETVYLRELLETPAFRAATSPLTLALGKTIDGQVFLADLVKMPHLLMAGATGTGKSVTINAIIASILYKSLPHQVKFIMIDPKMLELKTYETIPHLLLPVVTDPRKAAATLKWCVKEMMRRYTLLSEHRVRDISSYNRRFGGAGGTEDLREGEEPLPYIVLVIDELADLMLVASKDVEDQIARLAQMARAAGIHMILATQTPRADILTGLIKANFKARISFSVSSKLDSRVILDTQGAETLLGRGDMLYLSPSFQKLQRIHGAYIAEQEIEAVTGFLGGQGRPEFSLLTEVEDVLVTGEGEGVQEEADEDEVYEKACSVVRETKKASASYLQRRLRIGYNRAARIVERMEEEGLIGPQDGVKQREVHLERFGR